MQQALASKVTPMLFTTQGFIYQNRISENTLGIMSSQSMDTPLVLDGNPRKNMVAFAIIGLVVAVCAAKILRSNSFQAFYWVCGILSTLIALFIVYQAAHRLPRLTLTPEGFELSARPFSKKYTWSECYGFRVYDVFGPNGIAFRRKGFGTEGVIVNLFVGSSEELCNTMNSWHKRYGSA